jgi:lysophospholipase L1-like esterase
VTTSDTAPHRWRHVVFACIPVTLVLLLFELTLRLTGAHQHCHNPYRNDDLYVCDPVLYFRLRADLKPFGKPLNSQGFRSREFAAKSDGMFRILVVGDSCTFGVIFDPGLSYIEHPYPERLEELVIQNSGGPVEILNAGLLAYNSFQGLMLLKTKLRGLEPDLVIIRYGWNDHFLQREDLNGRAFQEPDNVLLRSTRDLLLRTAVYTYAVGKRMTFGLQQAAEAPGLGFVGWDPTVPLAEYEQNLERMATLVRHRGASVWLLTSPHAFIMDEHRGQYEKFKDKLLGGGVLALNMIPSFDELVRIHESYNEATRRVGARLNVPVVDMELVYRQHSNEHLFTDSDVIHATQQGHDVEARVLYDKLVEQRLVRAPHGGQ